MAGERNFVIKNGELIEYRGTKKKSVDIVIPANVTRIGTKVFLGYGNMTSVTIPEGVTEIGYEAFAGCSGLTSVSLPGTVTKIGNGAFQRCYKLMSITIPESVTSIGDGAFKGCRALADADGFVTIKHGLYDYYGPGGDVTIPTGVTRLEDEAFRGNSKLDSVTIPDGVTSIGVRAFAGCRTLRNVKIPDSVTRVWSSAFEGCRSLESVILPAGVTRLDRAVFSDCCSLKNVVIPAGVTEIGARAFYRCGLESIMIPDSVTSIGDEAFSGCTSLTSIMIPESVTSLGAGAFKRCAKMIFHRWDASFTASLDESTRIVILNEDVPVSAFPPPLRTAALRGYISGESRSKDPEVKKTYEEYAETNAISLCQEALTDQALLHFLCENRKIPAQYADHYREQAEKIGNTEAMALILNYQNEIRESLSRARDQKEKERELYTDALVARSEKRDADKGIEDMTFAVLGTPQSWGKKGRQSIREYLKIHGAKLASSVTRKTDYLVVQPGDKSVSEDRIKAEELGVPIITEEEFNRLVKKTYEDAVEINIPSWVRIIPADTFCEFRTLTRVTIPEGVTSIGDNAFARCSRLKSISVPESVTSIGDSAFRGCRGLADENGFVVINHSLCAYCGKNEEIKIPAGVRRIENGAFKKNPKIRSVTIPEGVVSIGSNAFEKCKSLEEVAIAGSVQRIGSNAFDGCTKLVKISIGDGVESLGEKVFQWCDPRYLIIPASVKEIGRRAVYECRALKEIHIQNPKIHLAKEAICNFWVNQITIYAPADSTAADYARENGMTFAAE